MCHVSCVMCHVSCATSYTPLVCMQSKYLHVCTSVRLHVCTSARLHVCTSARLHVCTSVRSGVRCRMSGCMLYDVMFVNVDLSTLVRHQFCHHCVTKKQKTRERKESNVIVLVQNLLQKQCEPLPSYDVFCIVVI